MDGSSERRRQHHAPYLGHGISNRDLATNGDHRMEDPRCRGVHVAVAGMVSIGK